MTVGNAESSTGRGLTMNFLRDFVHKRLHTGPLGGYLSRLGFKMPPPRDNFPLFSIPHSQRLARLLFAERAVSC